MAKNKLKRAWTGQFRSLAQSKGEEAAKGYGQARKRWDSLPAIEREARADLFAVRNPAPH